MASAKGIENWKAKKWFVVQAPKVFSEAQLGEMPGKDEKAVIGRNVIVSLDSLTHNPQNANTNLVFKITEVNGDRAQARLAEMGLLFSFVRTIVRRYKSVSTSVIKARTKDGVAMTVKPIVVTMQRSPSSKLKGIRVETKDFIEKYVQSNDSDTIIKAIIDGNMQQELYARLKHVSPLSKVEIRKLEIGK